MKLTTFSKSFIKFDNSSAFPTQSTERNHRRMVALRFCLVAMPASLRKEKAWRSARSRLSLILSLHIAIKNQLKCIAIWKLLLNFVA